MKKPKISIIIPVHNRRKFTENILSELESQIKSVKTKNFKVIVVDDGSTDGTKEMIESKFSEVIILEGNGKLWWTGAMVKGMKYAFKKLNSKYIVWLNNDLVLENKVIQKIQDYCKSKKYKETIVGGIVLDKTYKNWIIFSGYLGHKNISDMSEFENRREIDVDSLNGNIVVMPKNIISKIGFPDATKFSHYGGDISYTSLAKRNGFRIILSRKIKAKSCFQIEQILNYSPIWMQVYMEKNYFKKIKIITIKSLSKKYNQNIWHIMNLMALDKKVYFTDYLMHYIMIICKSICAHFYPKNIIYKKINHHFKSRGIPKNIRSKLLIDNFKRKN